MIYATVNMTIGDYSSTCDNKILLYRGDKNVEIRIVMKGNKFTVLDSTYAQMIIRRPSATSVFSEPAPIQNDTVIFVITEDMIDELKEIGEYTFQVRLYDDTMTARATLPPCNSALIIERPIAVEGEAAVNLAIVNDSAVMPAADVDEEEIFTEDNKYNRTIWVDGDLITDARLNKIEDALYYINENGGGGGGSATAPYISTELPETVMVGSDENFDLHLFFNSPNMGKGTLRVFINDADVMSVKIDQGDSTTVVSNNLFAKGTNRVVVYVLDRVGVMSNSLVFYIRYGSTEISSDFDPYSAYDYGATIRYYFTPTALDTSLTLTFYMSIDGQVQQGVNCTSDTRGYYTFPTNLSADNHYCEAYVVDSKGVKSNVLSFNLIILDANTLVVASDTKEVSVEEGEQVSLDYKVYMKYNTSFIANIYVDDALVNTGTCNADFNYYKTSSLTKGVHTVKLEVFDVTGTHSDYITWTVAVSDSTYEMLQPVNAGAMFIGTAVNKTNTDERKQYFIGHDQEGNEVLGTLTNFAFNSESGWVNDELIISGNSHVEIPVQPLANNAKYGFTLDIEFTSKQIGVPDAEVLTLWNDETNCGVKITTEKLILQSSNGNKCDLYFTDNEKTHVMFVIDRQELKAKIYLNGVMCEAFHLNDYTVEGVAYLDDFTVNSNIILGGLNTNGYCKIKNLRVYQVALTTDEIMNNFISCEIDKAKQRELSEFQKGNDLPTLYVYCDFSGLGKDDKKPCKIVYNSTNEALYGKSFNLDHKQSQLQYQGTSSMAYPIKNYRLNLRDENGDKWYYTLPTAQPECRFTLKADFMSSGHWTNTGMAKFINDKLYNYNVNDEKSMNPFKWEHVQNGGKVNDFRETISGFPCRLILVNDGETPLNTGQNEPTPGNTKDMGIFNFNNDKDNVTTLGFNSDIFPNCASYEVTANSDTSAGAFMSYDGGKDVIQVDYYIQASDQQTISCYIPISVFKGQSIISTSGAYKQLTFYDENFVDLGTHGTTSTYTVPTDAVYFTIRWFTGDCVFTNITFRPGNRVDGLSLSALTYPNYNEADELAYLKESFELRHPDADDVAEDWGYMGIEEKVLKIDEYLYYGSIKTSNMEANYFNSDSVTITFDNDSGFSFIPTGTNVSPKYGVSSGTTISLEGVDRFSFAARDWTYVDINGNRYYKGIVHDENIVTRDENPYESTIFDTSYSLKALIDWVDNCTDEEFVRDFEQHFHKDYTLRYFCLVTLIGAVDNLGKNMMLDTADNKIFFPRFYDIDTICSYDNSGQLKFDVDIEMEQGYWNTSSSRLWTRVRDLMHDDIVTTYNDMRQNGVSYENMMKYIYDEQIAKIPQAYYNKDYDVKYAPFADSYIGMAHGDTYEHVKRWLKQRFTFVDTLFDYAPSYNNDILTIRANTTELMTLEIETYTPVYLHLSWYNGQMDKKKIDGKVSVEFSGKAQAATDQEVLIYGGSNVKSIKGIQSANPNRLILGSATKLTELDASNCPLLAEINMNKANLSPHEYLNKVNLSNCPLLEGNLRLNNSPLIQELDIRGTKITGMNLPSSIRNLQVLKLPNTMTELTLNDAGMLHTLEFDEGVALQSISMTNCNALTNVVNFDLLQTPSIVLNNSYNSVAELYFRDTTNLSLSNMSNLERVIFTPNNEYETFELINVANAPDYKITTFNCPKLSTFMTTAPYRESFNDCGMKDVMGTVYETLQTDVALKLSQSSGADKTSGYFYTTEEGKGDCVSDFDYYKLIAGNSYKFTVKNGNWFIVCFYDLNGNFVRYLGGVSSTTSITDTPTEDCLVRLTCVGTVGTTEINILGDVYIPTEKVIKQIKDYGNIQPNTTFTANSIDISNTQFTDVKLLCTTDTNTLKLPATVKNFYCDSSFDLDTDYLEDGEYDVVHGELVEPYTTDYDGEVVKYADIIEGYPRSSDNITTDFISVSPGSTLSISRTSGTYGYSVYVTEYASDKSTITGNRKGGMDNYSRVIAENTAYVKIELATKYCSYIVTKQELKTPNLIPSSADGSLIFSMYAPSNAVAPASGTWDLHGLEFDNFHTFGMNNDANGGYVKDIFQELTEDYVGSYGSNYRYDNFNSDNCYIEFTFNKYKYNIYNGNSGCSVYMRFMTGKTSYVSWSVPLLDKEIRKLPSGTIVHSYGQTLTSPTKMKVYANAEKCEIYIKDELVITLTTSDTDFCYVYTGTATASGAPVRVNYANQDGQVGFTDVVVYTKTVLPLTMPARYDDYNITIKNAYIAPKTHNTMLYPLLVNEDNPITGTLDYTNYAGKHLSWSFAYTDEEYVNIIQPKLELINSYEYRYNAFYDTEYEFDNPYEIGRYTSNASGVLPGFNKEFTYTYDEIDNGDGTYTTKIYADSLDNLPTTFSFYTKSALLSVERMNVNRVTSAQGMFYQCSNLTYINSSNWNTSSMTSMNNMFNGCNKLTFLDVSGFDTSNVTTMYSMFKDCRVLTSLDVSNFDTSNVTNMGDMFNGCKNLTSLDVSGFVTSNVTIMYNMFNGCNKLTSLDVSGFDTSDVTNMANMFYGCNDLTSLDVSNFDTSNVTIMSSMFRDCSGLTSLDVSGFDTKNVTNMSDMFAYCSGLTSLDLSGFDISEITDMYNMFVYCSGLTSLNVENWTSDSVNTIIPQLSVSPSTSTLYGTVIIDESTLPSGWVYDNVLVIAKYTANATGVLPGFNTEFTGYTVGETNNGDGTYTVSIATDSLDNLPTKIFFTANNNLLTVDKLNTSKVTTMFQMFRSCVNLTRINCRLDTSSVKDEISQIFMDCKNLEYLDMTGFVNSNIKYVVSLFQSCESITHIVGLDTWDISSITNFSNMFANCYALSDLTAVENWDMSNAEVLDTMFARCNAIESFDLTKWDVSNVTNMRYMFGWARGPVSIDMTGWDTSNVTDMYYMFGFCNKLTEIKGLENFNTAKVTDMQYMLCEYQATELDLRKWNVSSVTNMCRLFEGCLNLQSLNISGWKTSNVTTMLGVFNNCPSLTTITGLSDLDTSKVTDMSNMFDGCKKLTSLDLSKWDTSKVENMNHAFYNCSSITELNLSGFTNVKDWGSFCRKCTNLVSITGLDTSKYSTNFGSNGNNFLNFEGCESLRNIKDINVSFTSAMAKANSLTIDNDYWMLLGWGWFRGLTNLVDITFTGQVELYDTMPVYYIFRGCDTTKFTHATWNTFVSIFPTTSTSKSIVLGGRQAILDAVPDEIKLALTQKGYTLTFRD